MTYNISVMSHNETNNKKLDYKDCFKTVFKVFKTNQSSNKSLHHGITSYYHVVPCSQLMKLPIFAPINRV